MVSMRAPGVLIAETIKSPGAKFVDEEAHSLKNVKLANSTSLTMGLPISRLMR